VAALSPSEVVKAWLRAFNRADPDAMASFYASDASLHLVPEQPVEGHEAIREVFVALFAGPELIWMVENLFENGEWAILEWRDPLGLRGCGFFQVLEGQIAVQRSYLDRLSFLRQHGLPVPRELA
jgi:limonene-1,2-epoxide hydrolase